MSVRFFTRDQLSAFGVPKTWSATGNQVAEHLHTKQVDTRRWESTHEMVFRAPDDGKAYRICYQQGLTEYQDCDTWFDEDLIEAIEVEPREVVVTHWTPVGGDDR